jgi:translation initiation factor 4G
MLTGSCKFGQNCRDYHPPLAEHAPCAPAKVPRQKSWSEESTGSHSGSDQEFAPSCSLESTTQIAINVQELSLDQVVKKVNGILNKLTPEKFDSLLQQLFAIVAADNSEAYLERVVPLIFAKAIAEPKNSALYATLTRHLYGLVGPDERPTVLKQLLQLCDRLLYEIADLVGSLSEDQATKLQLKRSGNVRFLSELYSEGVIPKDEVVRRLNYLVECSHEDGAEGMMNTQLVCELLTMTGAALPWTAVSPIVAVLPSIAAKHPTRVQFLVWNLLDLSDKEWSMSSRTTKRVSSEPPSPACPPFSCRISVDSSTSSSSAATSLSTPEHSPFLKYSETANFSFCYDPYSANLYRTPYPRGAH